MKKKEEHNLLSDSEINELLIAISAGEIKASELNKDIKDNLEDFAGRLIQNVGKDNLQIMFEGKELKIVNASVIQIEQMNNKMTYINRIDLEAK